MTKDVARTRIGRVTMKNGGADMHVLHPKEGNRVTSHMRAWISAVTSRDSPPDGYAAVAFWFDKAAPGFPTYEVGYSTAHDAISPPELCRIAAAQIREEPCRYAAEVAAIEAMGGIVAPWEPDDAS